MKKRNLTIIVAICIVLMLFVGYLFIATGHPDTSSKKENIQKDASWKDLVAKAERQNAAGEFAKKFKSEKIGGKIIQKSEITEKTNARQDQERRIISEISASIETYPEFLGATLRKISNKAVYQALLYTNKEVAKKELLLILEGLGGKLAEIRQLEKELTLYQVSRDAELSEVYKALISKLKVYDSYGTQLQDYINETIKLAETPQECLKFVAKSHPTLVENWATIK